MNYSTKVNKLYDGMNMYETLIEDESAIFLIMALGFELTSTTINGQLDECNEDLDNNRIQELPDIDFKKMTNPENFHRTGKLKYDMEALENISVREHLERLFGSILDKTPVELCEDIYTKNIRMTESLKNIYDKLLHGDPSIFQKNFYKVLMRYDWSETEAQYQAWKDVHSEITLEMLQEKQDQEIMRVLKMDIMHYASKPSQDFLDRVDYDYHRSLQQYGFTDNEDYKLAYAKFRRYASRKEQLVTVDLKKYGKYIFLNAYKFREEQKVVLYQLIYILNLIHRDMVELKPELGKYLGLKSEDSIEGTRYFAIYINMVEMFRQEWFEKYRSDKKYDLKWIRQFLNDLLRSEWRDEIADDWYKPDKVLSVKGNIIGCLKEAGVLNGSDLSIAKAVVEDEEIEGKTFAIYFGKGRKKNYCDWICNYVRH